MQINNVWIKYVCQCFSYLTHIKGKIEQMKTRSNNNKQFLTRVQEFQIVSKSKNLEIFSTYIVKQQYLATKIFILEWRNDENARAKKQ